MRFLILLMFALRCSAQLPVIPVAIKTTSPFTPEQIPNLFAEFYADSSLDWLGATGGGFGASGIGWSNRAVTTWDLTRSISDEGTSPIYANTGPNSLFCVDFVGNASGSGAHKLWAHGRNSTSVVTLSNQPNTFFIVAIDKSGTGGHGLFDADSGGRELFDISTDNNVGNSYAGVSYTFPPDANNSSSWYIFTVVFNGTSSYTRTNGVLYASGNVGTQAMGQMVLANQQGDTVPYVGKMYAILGYSTATLSTNNMIAVEKFLNTKANLGYTIPGP